MRKPIIVVPMGDPAGIGPEIVIKALCAENVKNRANCVVIGDKSVLEKNAEICEIDAKFNVISDIGDADFSFDGINLIDLNNAPVGSFEPGQVNGICGKASFEYIKLAIEIALEKKADAVCTPPINKEALKAGNVTFIGHTEIFGDLTGTADPLTLFEVRNMRVFFLSRHVSLRKACDMVTPSRIMDYVKRCTEALAQLGVKEGTMAVAGLNPHSGEHGLFGTEEMEAVAPAVDELKNQDIWWKGLLVRILFFIWLCRDGIIAFCLCIMTKDILLQKLWTLNGLLPLPVGCRFYVHLWIMELLMILLGKTRLVL